MAVPFREQMPTALSPTEHATAATSHYGENTHEALSHGPGQQDPSHAEQQNTTNTGSSSVGLRHQDIPIQPLTEQHDYEDSSQMRRAPSITQYGPPPALSSNTATAEEFDMLAPPTSTHPSWQALHDFAQSHASEHGYALSINTTAKNRSRIKLACVCYGQPKNTHKLTPETRVRKNRVSYKTGCKMWVEGKKQDDGTWLLRVGEGQHNHQGKASEGWAAQRKRTWGVVGGRIGVGGVTATEEARRRSSGSKETADEVPDDRVNEVQLPPMAIHKLEHGGIIWKIVEQEMLRKGEPGQGRDRGVGRTVEVLQARLPGIHIFKRDVYNIRAQIKRARKAAGQQVGEGLNESEAEVEAEEEEEERGEDHGRGKGQPLELQSETISHLPHHTQDVSPSTVTPPTGPSPPSRIDPSLTAPEQVSIAYAPRRTSVQARQAEIELERLQKENEQLQRLLHEKTDDIKKKTIEIASLRSQVDYMNMMGMSSSRGGLAG